MATLAEIRAQYPQYSDMTDTALADALYKKFYSDLPRADFEQKIGLKAAPSQSTGIPGMRRVQPGEIPTASGYVAAPVVQQEPSAKDRLLGLVETPVSLISSAVGGVVGPAARLYGELTAPAKLGTREAEQAGIAAQQAVERGLYRPQTQTGQQIMGAIGKGAEALLPMAPIRVGPAGAVMSGVQPAVDIARAEAGLIGEAAQAPLAARQARVAEQRIAQSYARAPQIDAAQDASRLGIALNPAISNPTLPNRVRVAIAGSPETNATLAKTNESKWTQIGKNEMGIAPDVPLTSTEAFDKARAKLSGPYNEVRKIPKLTADESIVQTMNSLRSPELIGGEAATAKVNALIDDAIAKVTEGRSGALVIDDIRKLRRDATATYNAQKKGVSPPKPEDVTLADTNMRLANVLETLVENNVRDPKLLGELRDARAAMAKTYAYERATDFNTGLIDPQAIAKITAADNALTGDIAAIGRIAGNFPEVSQTGVAQPKIMEKLRRTGVAGTVGAGIGAATGFGPILGGALGAGAEQAISAGMLSRMRAPEFQRRVAVPTDYRPTNMLTPADINYGPNQLVVFDPRNAVLPPEVRPNWVFGQTTTTPEMRMGPFPSPAQLPAPSAESTLAALRAEDVRRAGVSRALGQEAEARQAAAEAAARQPATGGVAFELDPITGRLREVSQGIKGATPEQFVNFGADLASAAKKVTEGRLFDMTQAERVAWNRTQVDIKTIAPEFNKLSDKAISEKMLDRQWIESTIQKARDKARAFEEIAARAKTEQARQEALANRERMLDTLDSLEETLRVGRPVERGGQGPKTRAFNRNKLSPETEITNALVKP